MYLSGHFVLKRPYLSPAELNHECILLMVHKEFVVVQIYHASGNQSRRSSPLMNRDMWTIKLSIYQQLFCIATLPTSLAHHNDNRKEKIKKQQVNKQNKAHLFWQISSNDVKLDWNGNVIVVASITLAIVESSENQIPIQHVIQRLLILLDIPNTGLENFFRKESGYSTTSLVLVFMTTGEYFWGKNKVL